jgi:hypothetical protein
MNTIPTSHGNLTPEQIVDLLTYQAYAYHRDKGSTHEQLVKAGFGNDKHKQQYEAARVVNNN